MASVIAGMPLVSSILNATTCGKARPPFRAESCFRWGFRQKPPSSLRPLKQSLCGLCRARVYDVTLASFPPLLIYYVTSILSQGRLGSSYSAHHLDQRLLRQIWCVLAFLAFPVSPGRQYGATCRRKIHRAWRNDHPLPLPLGLATCPMHPIPP